MAIAPSEIDASVCLFWTEKACWRRVAAKRVDVTVDDNDKVAAGVKRRGSMSDDDEIPKQVLLFFFLLVKNLSTKHWEDVRNKKTK